ncbi:hypothetical protein [Rhizobium sp. RU36D]|uniref:hypothetical protein n=1 Tax=Rhizobium sp. RU36D TaxID=1907415 RepID=UPI0009D7C79C|nr:hypothetical protein [Rhizobium sp. RU36D]SMD16193.1 hypothetical protein SAMN05880593_1292 [Rhizobium sp. RU36D]
MAKSPRRGKGSGKTTDEGKIRNSVSASDGKSGRSDEKYTLPAPKPPQPPRNGRTDLNAAQGFRLAQEIANHTTPQMSRKERAEIEKMKGPVPQPNSPAPRGMGMGSSYEPEPEVEQAEFVRLDEFEINRLAYQSIRDEWAGREAADLTHIHPDDFRAIEDAVPAQQRVFDKDLAGWQKVGKDLSLTQMSRMTAEGDENATVTTSNMTYRKEGDWLVGNHVSGDRELDTRHEFRGVFSVVAEKPESQRDMAATIPAGNRFAVFFGYGSDRTQFTDSMPWREEAGYDRDDIRGVLVANGEEALAERLYVGVLTPYERALEQVEQREPQEGQRHERVFAEITGRDYASLSNPAVERPFAVTAEDMKAVENGFEQAPTLAVQQGAETVRDALPHEGRALTAEGLKEQYQWHANKMHDEGRDLRDIYADTGVKPQGADQTAWEKTEYVYGQPTALDRLQELGTGAFAVSPTGYTYALSDDGKELMRFDADGNPAGQKPVEDVQAFLQEKRGVEFDQKQEAKEMHAAELAEQRVEDQVASDRKIVAYQSEDPKEVQEAMNDREAGSEIGEWPVAVRMDEIRSEVGEMTSGMSAWQIERSYDDARSNLTAWDGNEMDTYVDLHARANLIGENAGYGQDRIYQDREYDIYRMSADAKYQLDNAGVNVDAIERGVDHRVGLHDEMAVLLQREEGRGVTKEEFVEARQAVSAYLSEMPEGHVHKSDSFDTYTLKGDELHIDFHANRDLGYTSVYDAKSIEWKGDLDHQTGVLHGASIASEMEAMPPIEQNQAISDQSKEFAAEAVNDMNQVASQPLTESQQETAALLRGDMVEIQQTQRTDAVSEIAPETENMTAVEQAPQGVSQDQEKATSSVEPEPTTEIASEIKSEPTREVEAQTTSKQLEQDSPVADKEPEQEMGTKIESAPQDDLRAEFAQDKAAYEAKHPEQAITAEVEQKVEAAPGDDLRSDFAQDKAVHDAKQQSQPEEKAQDVVQQEASEKAPQDDLRNEFAADKASAEAKQANPPEEAVQQEEEEEYRRGPGMAA